MMFTVKHLGRVARSRLEFYAFGLGLAETLDRLGADWKRPLVEEPGIWLDDLLARALAQRAPLTGIYRRRDSPPCLELRSEGNPCSRDDGDCQDHEQGQVTIPPGISPLGSRHQGSTPDTTGREQNESCDLQFLADLLGPQRLTALALHLASAAAAFVTGQAICSPNGGIVR